MGFFEFFGERFNPGNVGRIEKSGQTHVNINIGVLIFKTVISAAILIGLYAVTIGRKFDLKGTLIYIGVIFAYCFISYWITPKPDYSNIGWFGGLVDHPFRYSDDLNRMLIFLLIILYPGKLISTTIVAWIWLIRDHRPDRQTGNTMDEDEDD